MTASSCSTKKILLHVLFALCLSTSVCWAKSGFMRRPSVHARGYATRGPMSMGSVQQELEEALTEALGQGHGVSQSQMEAKRTQIEPMFESMPKNLYGHVDRDALQYMVRRFFGAGHGWSIRGFEPPSMSGGNAIAENATTGGANGNDALTAKILKQKLPLYIESVLESRLDHKGFALNDVVTMVAVLERMIFDEGVERLEAAYEMLGKSVAAPLSLTELKEVIHSYMLIYAFEASRTNVSRHAESLRIVEQDFPEGYPSSLYGWAETEAVLAEMRVANPFATTSVVGSSSSSAGAAAVASFDVALQAVMRTNEGYGQWSNEEECVALKEGLTEADKDGQGRVSLVDFYGMGGIGGTWEFKETPEYLRSLGVLDDTSPTRGPQIMIPNYVQGMSNCIDVSGFYSLCCVRECEAILGVVERAVLAPLAAPAEILQVVQRLIHAREEEPRNLTLQLTAQLEAIGDQNQGRVPIHGRLFQQWLHYAFPYECPYPAKRDTVDAAISAEWANMTGMASLLTASQIEELLADAGADGLSEAAALSEVPEIREMSAWTMEEELYVGYHHQGPRRTLGGGFQGSGGIMASWNGVFGGLAKAGILVAGVLSLGPMAARNWKPFFVRGAGGKRQELLV